MSAAVMLTLTVVLLSASLMEAAAVVPECGGVPAFWGATNYKLVAKEQVTIPPEKSCIFLEGEGRGTTIIEFSAHSQTDTSSTFCSYPPDIVATGITFKNTYNLGFPLPKAFGDNSTTLLVPALAARIYGDKSAFYDCGFIGVQDTLWDVQGRHYYLNCYIEGAIDFIFGNGQSFYENTQINATGGGFITAQRRTGSNDPSGFVFYGGQVEGAAPGIQFLRRLSANATLHLRRSGFSLAASLLLASPNIFFSSPNSTVFPVKDSFFSPASAAALPPLLNQLLQYHTSPLLLPMSEPPYHQDRRQEWHS
ncbi:Putative pectinesterase 52 [Linum perenne]